MSLVINNNIPALNVANNLNRHYNALQTSTRRLSSGLRVGTAADDAAGLAIRELMRAEIAAMRQGVRNANDAISLLQTADGALGIIDEKLIRMKELAEQAATGTYDSTQRLMIESEYQAMASEITRIANATSFNNVRLIDGSLSGPHGGGTATNLSSTGELKIHFGPNNNSAEDYYYIRIGNSTASALGLGNESDPRTAGHSISTQSAAQAALVAITEAIISKDKIRAHLGALQNSLENTVTNLTIQAENLQAAESRISDVDVALEMTNFVRNQILAQAAVSMLAQANSLPRMALNLIG
jgi:flagellin